MDQLHVPDAADHAALLALNNAHSRETSPLGPDDFGQLLDMAYRVRTTAGRDALCIALDQDADYRNPNFEWFRARHPRFVYVDRVIVGPGARRKGMARRFYEDLFAAMRQDGYGVLCCEVNIQPPNPASDRFHAAMGFAEVGRADLADRGKTVRYLERAT